MRIPVAPHTLESQTVLVFCNIFHPGGCIMDLIVVLWFCFFF